MVEVDEQLAQLISNGEKIAAIKLLREHTGMGLAEAKAAVEHATAGGRAPVATAVAAGDDGIPDEVRALVERGERIAAIRLLRERQGIDLMDSKQRIDRAFGPDPRARRVGAVLIAAVVAGAAAFGWLVRH